MTTNPWLEFDDDTKAKVLTVYREWSRLTARLPFHREQDVTDLGRMVVSLKGNVGPLLATMQRVVEWHMNKHGGLVPNAISYCIPAMKRDVADALSPRHPQAIVHRPPPDFSASDLGPEPDMAAGAEAVRKLREGL